MRPATPTAVTTHSSGEADVTCRSCAREHVGVCLDAGLWLSDPDAPFYRLACPAYVPRPRSPAKENEPRIGEADGVLCELHSIREDLDGRDTSKGRNCP